MQKLVTRFGNPCDICLEGLITNTKKRRRGKNMSATDIKKTTTATSETFNEAFHEARRSYETLKNAR